MITTYVFVPGSFSNSFMFGPLVREVALHGHRALAVDLPGHGYAAGYSAAYQAPQDLAAWATAPSAQAGVTLADTVEATVDVVRRAAAHGPVVLVAHSRGGLTATGVANRVPDLLHHLVYASAWCCVDTTPAEYHASAENAGSVLDRTIGAAVGNPAELGALRFNYRTGDPAVLAALHEALLADGTEAEMLAFLNTLEPDENLDGGGMADRADPATWGTVARTYVRFTADRSLPVELQDRFIAEADRAVPGRPFAVRSLDASHVGPLVRPGELAELLVGLAG
ncbi:alpha/beta hydrolase [Actinocatenispora rupis]|uniref:AB hydrolase-1 domain-containing protein n=1 Tax=Actinocatenispora rupis TaxID=519421 RepID=A0A8J3J3P6_9ACTN|nr:alpha/beta hydrolase [Actinocatenispora rupis]GID09564.1 hypothetical protein Aru02nite_04530 [Actinocatenispora rupis]